MRFSLAILAAFVASATASSVLPRQIPNCAGPCIAGPDVDFHGCKNDDNDCLCHNSEFITESTACIQKACTDPADLQAALSVAQSLCLAAGVTLSAPPSATAPGGAAPTGSAGNDTTPGGNSTTPGGNSTTPGGNSTTPGGNGTANGTDTAPAPTGSSAAMSNSLNTLAGVAALGLAALVL